MIKSIKNITPETLSITLFGHIYEIPAGWSLTTEETWGGEETLRYVAVKFADKIETKDEEGEIMKCVECPGCGTKVAFEEKKQKEVVEAVEEVEVKEEPKKTGGRSKK